MDAQPIVAAALVVVGIVAGVAETVRQNRKGPTPELREADRRRTAALLAVGTSAACLVLIVLAVASLLRGWWVIAVLDAVLLIPGVWFSLTRWRLFRSL